MPMVRCPPGRDDGKRLFRQRRSAARCLVARVSEFEAELGHESAPKREKFVPFQDIISVRGACGGSANLTDGCGAYIANVGLL